MTHKLKKIRLSAVLVSFLSGITVVEAAPQAQISKHPGRTEGLAFGFGAGVKLLNLKNIITKTTSANPPVVTRGFDSFANASTPVISVYGRKYMPCLIGIPTFLGFEFNYLTDMRKKNINSSFNSLPGGIFDSGYRYEERWDARVMLGAQVWSWSQLDLWAQAGLQVTNFYYEGITSEVTGVPQTFKMDNNYALAPAGGLELRYSQPGLVGCNVVTDFILGWTAGYRNAFTVTGTTTTPNSFNFAMSSNWSHTFGLKVLFRY